MAKYSYDNATGKYISADGQIMGGGTAYKTESGGWSLEKPTNTPANNTSANSTPAATSTSTSTQAPTGGPADGYATATERNMATNGAEFGTNNRVTETQKVKDETVVKTDAGTTQNKVLTPLDKEYYQQTSQEAQDKIISNLNNYKQTNPEYFSDYDTFKRNFNYDGRNDIQKQTLDTWYGGYQKGLQLSSLPVTDLYTQYKDGRISPNDLESLRISNPTKYAELQNTINRGNIIQAYDDDKGQDTTGMSMQDMAYKMMQQTFMQFMNGDNTSGASQYFREYEEKMNDPEMLALSDQTTEIQENMENLQTDIDFIKKTVEKEYEGTGASRAKINAIISDRTYDLQLQLRTLNSEYNKYATQYNNRMQQYQTEFSMQLQEYQINMQERNQKMNELGFAMDLMSFETPQQKQDRERDYWVKQQEYQNGNINSKDYQTRFKAALNSVQNLLSQYEGIPMQRSAEQMADDILKAIDGGSNLGAELTKINKLIQQKPEYKYLYNKSFNPATSGQNIQTYKVGDTDYVVYNGEMMTAADFNKKYGNLLSGATGAAKPYDLVDAKVFSQDPVDYGYNTLGSFLLDKKQGNTGGWCGAFVNQYLKHIGVTNDNYYDNELSTKLNSVNSQTPTVGSIAVFDYGHITEETGKNHGHVGIVTKVYGDGSYDVIDSNYGSDKKIQIRTHLNPNSSNCKGFFDPSKPPVNTGDYTPTSTQTETDGLGYIQSRIGLYDDYIKGKKPTDAWLKSLGDGDLKKGTDIFEAEVDAYKQAQGYSTGYSPEAEAELTSLRKEFNNLESVKTYNSMKDYYDKMMRANNGTAAGDIAMVFNFMKMLDKNSVVREGEFAQAASTAGLGTKLVNYFRKIDSGKILSKEQRQDFINIAKEYLQGAADSYNRDLRQYQTYITKGGDPTKIGEIADLTMQSYSTPASSQSTQTSDAWRPTRYYTLQSNTTNTGVGSTSSITVDGYSFSNNFYS